MSCTPDDTLWMGTTHVLEVSLRDVITDQPVSSATVTVTLYDSAGNPVEPDNWPITMTPDVEPGEYRATFDADLQVKDGYTYRAQIVATDGATQLVVNRLVVARGR